MIKSDIKFCVQRMLITEVNSIFNEIPNDDCAKEGWYTETIDFKSSLRLIYRWTGTRYNPAKFDKLYYG